MQGQGPSLQGPGQGLDLQRQGQGEGLDSQGPGKGQGFHLQLLTASCSKIYNRYPATTMNTK